MRNNLLLLFLFIVISLLFTGKSYSQENNYALVADVMPQPVGGIEELYKNITYPAVAKTCASPGPTPR